MRGSVRTAWTKAGGVKSALGYPTSDEKALTKGGWGQSFQKGAIVGSSKTGTHTMTSTVYKAWSKSGREKGKLGFPLSDSAKTQRFQGCQLWCVIVDDC